MGKWFLDFSFWIQGYRTAQTAHCALYYINVHKGGQPQASTGGASAHLYCYVYLCLYLLCVNDASNAGHRPPLHCTATLVAAAGLAQVASNANLSTSPISNPGNKTSIWEKPNIWSFLRRFFSAGVNHKG